MRIRGTAAAVVMVTLTASSCGLLSDNDAPDVVPETATEATRTGPNSTVPDSDEPTSTAPPTVTEPLESVSTEPLRGLYEVEVLNVMPHDPNAFTQGLELHDGVLLESVGLRGQSQRRWVDVPTGQVEQAEALDDTLFGEGLTIVDDRILQLTFEAGLLIVSDRDTLIETTTIPYDGQGWGLCYTGHQLAMSNGSAEIVFRDASSFAPLSSVEVIDGAGNRVERLNELECVNGQVLANIWGSDQVVVIDPDTGMVDAVIDASSLRPADAPADDLDYALNGIAYDATTGHYLLTGKLWSVLYEVVLVPTGS